MASGKNPGMRTPKSKNSKKRLRRAGPISWLLALLSVCGTAYFLFELIKIDVLPMRLLLVGSMIIVLLMLLLLMGWLLKARRTATRFILGFLVCALGFSLGVGGFYVKATETMFQEVTNLTDKQVNTVTVYAMSESGITSPGQLGASAVVGTLPGLDGPGTQGALSQLTQKGANPQTRSYSDPFSLVDALYAHEVDAIAFPEQYHDQIYEVANDANKYNALTTFTNVVDTYLYYTKRDQTSINPPDPVSNIMRDPFVVLVSGNDSYGSIGTNSRSDVNMLVCVNPATAQVLIISIPRDTYTPITCKKNRTACENVAGLEDKLTHSGVYGVASTESTVEDLLGIRINYYVRVNFSSLINIVDAIGGIDVDVAPGLEVDRFYANGTEGVHAGINHLDGERALAFSRERYAYVDGDNQRIKNQQIVLSAMIKAMMSPAMAMNYPKVMQALSTAFDTNMSAQEIKSLITLELASFPKWNIQSYAIPGVSDTRFSPSVNDLTSVTLVSRTDVAAAKALIDQLVNGETVQVESAPTTPSLDDLDQDETWSAQSVQPDSGQVSSAQEDRNSQEFCTQYPYDPGCQ